MWKKLTERYNSNTNRTTYVNTNLIECIVSVPGSTLTRLFFSNSRMVDVFETPEHILDIEETVLLTDKDKADGGSRDENGRVSNPAIKPDR